MRIGARQPDWAKALTMALLLSLAASAAPGAADDGSGDHWMSEADLARTFSGAAVDGHYRSGRQFSESYDAGGRVEYREGPEVISGRWSVAAGTFCTIYDNDPSGGCYRVRRDGQNCFEFYFVARTEETARVDPGKPSWTARAWLKSSPSTCREAADV